MQGTQTGNPELCYVGFRLQPMDKEFASIIITIIGTIYNGPLVHVGSSKGKEEEHWRRRKAISRLLSPHRLWLRKVKINTMDF